MLKSRLCNYSKAYILVISGKTTIEAKDNAALRKGDKRSGI